MRDKKTAVVSTTPGNGNEPERPNPAREREMPRHSHSHVSSHSRFARRGTGFKGIKLYALIAVICIVVATLMHAASLMSQQAEEYAQMAVQSAVNKRVGEAVAAQRLGR